MSVSEASFDVPSSKKEEWTTNLSVTNASFSVKGDGGPGVNSQTKREAKLPKRLEDFILSLFLGFNTVYYLW